MTSKFKRLVQFLNCAPRTQRYIYEIKRSGQFDREYFKQKYSDLHPLFQAFPERFYAIFGEALGFQPNPRFSPSAYLQYNDDLDLWRKQPFRHFIRYGHRENRLTQDVAPPVRTLPPLRIPIPPRMPPSSAPVAIVVHVYYHDLWAEIATCLKATGLTFDLFVTIAENGDDPVALTKEIQQEFPDARVLSLPNHGRDIFPFLFLINAGYLAPYDAVCKIHTKKSPHRADGHAWRTALLHGLLGGKDLPDALQSFLQDSGTAIWVADGQRYIGEKWWGPNFDKTARFLERVEIQISPTDLIFPAGSMYWIKPLVLQQLQAMQLRPHNFEREQGQVDGTAAHCLERSLGFIAADAGLQIRERGELATDSRTKPQHIPPVFISTLYHTEYAETEHTTDKLSVEWDEIAATRPYFAHHLQPCLPVTFGSYRQNTAPLLSRQAALAKQSGITAFCMTYRGPDAGNAVLQSLLQEPTIDCPFYLCWNVANNSKIDLQPLIDDLTRYMQDPRYQSPKDNRPRLLMADPEALPDATAFLPTLRQGLREALAHPIEIGAFAAFNRTAALRNLLDFEVADPISAPSPKIPQTTAHPYSGIYPDFRGMLIDYKTLKATFSEHLSDRHIPSVSPSWDTTATEGPAASIAYGGTPGSFHKWLTETVTEILPHSYNGEIFIRSWNGWHERTALEPGQKYGLSYLNVLAQFAKPANTAETILFHSNTDKA